MPIHYQTKKGDSLKIIAYKHYGDGSKAVLINEANPRLNYIGDFITTAAILVTGQNLIIPDQVDPIPSDTPETQKTVSLFDNTPSAISADDENEVGVFINNRVFRNFNNMNMKFDYDKIADEFSFTSRFDPNVAEYRDAFKPIWQRTAIYIGGSLVVTGESFAQPVLSSNKNSVNVKGFGITGTLSRTVLLAPFEFDEGSSFTAIAVDVCRRIGLAVVIDPLAVELSSKPFEKRVSFSPTEAIGGKLSSLARERGLILSKTFNGRLLITIPNTESATVQAFVSGSQPVIAFVPNYNPDALATSYMAYAPENSDEETESDNVSIDGYPQPGIMPRVKAITPRDTDNQGLEDALRAERGRAFGEWLTATLDVRGWRDSNNDLYRPNTIVTVKAPRVMVYDDTAFFIRAVNLSKSDKVLKSTHNLILPEAYTGRDLKFKV